VDHQTDRALPAVSVVMAVRNESACLADAVSHVLEQDYQGELELVVAVGPSADGTEVLAAELAASDARIRLVDNPTGKTPAGLNAAFRASRHDVVVRADGHSLLPADYVRHAEQLIHETGADVVGGVMEPAGVSPFQEAVARAMRSRLGVGSAPFRTGAPAGPADSVYLGVYRRSALERTGGFDEHYTRGQDWELNYRVRQTGGLVYFSPQLRVGYRPRSSLRALATQYYRTGQWRRVIVRAHPHTASPRYLAPPVVVVAIAVGAVGGVWRRELLAVPGAYLAALVGGAAVTGSGMSPAARLRLPVVYATMHLAWGLGFLTSPAALVTDARSPAVAGAA
jgi:glycosyltransferase involved in cell wall biosynthesis